MGQPEFGLLLGRRITGAILKYGKNPTSQLFLILDDGTYTEIYSESLIIVSAGWPGDADKARKYTSQSHTIKHEAYLNEGQKP